jgi:tight adherence protein B
MISLPILLTFSVFMLLGLFALSFAFMQTELVEKRILLRVDRVANNRLIQNQENAQDNLRLNLKYKERFVGVLKIFKVDLNRSSDYPVQWWLVLTLAVFLGRGISVLISMLLGKTAILAWPVLVIFISRSIFGMFHRRRAAALFKQFPDALGTIVRCVRVGIPVQESLRIVSKDMPQPTAQEFSRLADKVAIGVSLESALQELAARNQLAEYHFFATALSLQARTGGPLAQTLETLADVIRKRVAMRARGRALASEARTSAIVLGVLPIFAGVAIWALQPSYIDSLFLTSGGHKIFASAIALLFSGAFIMRTIIQRSLT